MTDRPGLTVNFVFPEEILINDIGKDTLEGFQTYLVSRGTIVVVKWFIITHSLIFANLNVALHLIAV